MNDTQQHLPVIIDECIEDVLLGVSTVEECLDRWPDHRDQIEPLLRAAIAVSGIPVADVQPDPARRAAFMAALRATPQESPRRGLRLPTLPDFGLGASALRFASVASAAAVIAIVAVALVWTGGGSSTASAATLTVFTGQVEEQIDGAWRRVEDGAAVRQGAVIRTSSESLAMVTFPDGSTATLDGATQLAFEEILVNGSREIRLRQDSGRVWNDVVPIMGGDTYVIQTPHALVRARGTVFETNVDGSTAVHTAQGLVSLFSLDGGLDIPVPEGQVVSTNAEGVTEQRQAPRAGQITVEGPVAAYLSSPSGAATGALLDGLVLRQIPGIVTTGIEEGSDGPSQRIAVTDTDAGVYTLVLRRFGPGDATLVVETAGGTLTIPVPASVEIARLPLEVERDAGGVTTMRTRSMDLESVGEAPQVRVVETERSRAANIEAQRTATAATADTPAAVATQATATATAATAATAVQTPAPTDTTTATPPVTPTPDAWTARYEQALSGGSDRELRTVLRAALDGDASTRAGRLTVIAASVVDAENAAKVRSAAGEDLREALVRESERVSPGVTPLLREGLLDGDRRGGDDDRDRGGGRGNDRDGDRDSDRGGGGRDSRNDDNRNRQSGSDARSEGSATATAEATPNATRETRGTRAIPEQLQRLLDQLLRDQSLRERPTPGARDQREPRDAPTNPTNPAPESSTTGTAPERIPGGDPGGAGDSSRNSDDRPGFWWFQRR